MNPDILAGARLIQEPGDVHELRVPKVGRRGTISGYFDSPEAMAEAASLLDADESIKAIYVTLNPVNTALLARACNRLVERAESTTSDADIILRRWLLIDCDPVRPTGISSSADEHGAAIGVACGVIDFLKGHGWPEPVVCDSGNGAHLLYRIDEPNTPETTTRIKRLLGIVACACGTTEPSSAFRLARVAIDGTVYNAARIVKLHGSWTRKGDNTPERPWRQSRVLEIPDTLTVVSLGGAR